MAGSNRTDGDIYNFERVFVESESAVNGSLEAGEVYLTAGQLSISGTLISTITNINISGIFSPGMPDLVGNISHIGTLNFNADSFYRVDFDPTNSTHDEITQIGDLMIDPSSSLQVRPISVDNPLQDGEYLIITHIVTEPSGTCTPFQQHSIYLDPSVVDADDTTYDVTNTGGFTSSAVTLNTISRDHELYLTVDHDYTKLAGLSAGGMAMGEYLNGLVDDPTGNDGLADFLGYLDYSDDSSGAAALNSYNPSLHVSAGDTLLHMGHSLGRLVENHLELLRLKAPVNQWKVWTNGAFESSSYERGDEGELEGDNRTATVGVDYLVNERFILGFFGQLGNAGLDADNNELDIDSTYFGFYGNCNYEGGLYVDFLLAYGDHEIDSGRMIFPLGMTDASYDADGYTGMISGGYNMGDASSSWNWSPVASIEFQSMDIDGFTESGDLPLTIDSREADSLRSLIGVKGEYTSSDSLDWYGLLRWAHDFSADDDRDIKASFGDLDGGFTTTANDRSEDAIVLNLGVVCSITENFTVGLSYFGEISLDDDGADSHGGALEAAFSF